MSGRRSHPRFTVVNPWDGAVRVLRAVVVDRTGENELVAVSHAPGVVGEEMSLDLLGAGSNLTFKVRVLESCPVILSSAVRHKVRLALIDAPAPATLATTVGIDAAVKDTAETI
jgi:hypothetical protein